VSGRPDIRIDVKPIAAAVEGLEGARAIVEEELTAAAWKSELLLEREAKELAPVGIGGGGGFKGSISAREPQVMAAAVLGVVGSPLSYAVPLELGTKPHMPPIEPLADWAQMKLGIPPDQARGVGFAIARKIARKGTEGAHAFERAFEASEPQVQRFFGQAGERIAERLGGGK